MTNSSESSRWLKDAQVCLGRVEKYFPTEDYVTAVQNAQLCIEMSAKAVIAYFAEPAWKHDPSEQLSEIIGEQRERISEECKEEMIEGLLKLGEDAKEAAPWHGWSTYGREDEEGRRISAVELCTKEIAENLLQKARKSYQTASKFFELVSSSNKEG